MAEYIEREAFAKAREHPCTDIDDMQEIAQCFPAADVVEVVRCKDCIHARRHEVFPHSRRCQNEDCRFSHKETHFCSYGERRVDHDPT